MDIMSLNISFATAYETLAKEEPLTCFKTGEQLPAAPSPDVAILDVGTTLASYGSFNLPPSDFCRNDAS